MFELNFPTLLELIVVLGLNLYIVRIFWRQLQSLAVLMARLNEENAFLINTKETHQIVNGESLVAQRWRAIEQHRLRHRDGALPEGLHLSAAARSQNATEEARFWAGAFVFIGLCGTLACLGIAVFFLMQTISRGGDAGSATNFKSITSHMTSTFMSMGLAFVCTIVGTLCTVLLSARIATYERAAETLRLEIEVYAFEKLEPLALAKAGKSREDLLDGLVERMERVAGGFGQTIETALIGLQSMATSTAYSSEKLDAAAANFETAARNLSDNTQQMNGRLADLKSVFDRQEISQGDWQLRTTTALGALETAMHNANETFVRLDTLRDDWKTGTGATRALHQSTLNRLLEAGSESTAAQKELLDGLQASITVGLQELRLQQEKSNNQFLTLFKKQRTITAASETQSADILGKLERLNTDASSNSLGVLNGVKQEINAGLEKIVSALDESQQHDALRLKQLGDTVVHLSNYLAHVENTMRQIPAMLGSEPIIAYEKERDDTLEAVRTTLQAAGKEVGAWRNDLKILLETSQQRLNKIDERVGGLHNGLDKFAQSAAQQETVLKNVHQSIQGLETKVDGVQTHLTNTPEQRVPGRFGRS